MRGNVEVAAVIAAIKNPLILLSVDKGDSIYLLHT